MSESYENTTEGQRACVGVEWGDNFFFSIKALMFTSAYTCYAHEDVELNV